MRDDPEVHFKKLKAKIKLKVVKQFQEDEEKRKEEEIVRNTIKTVITDKYGREVKKVAPKMSKTRLPSMNRQPIKRQPPKRLRSFTEVQ